MQVDALKSGEHYVLCICEGRAEEDILNCLLDANLLVFNRSDLINRKIIRTRAAWKIQEEFLNLSYKKPVVILRIIDSKNEKFKLDKAYIDRYKERVINIITQPEIEMLIIISKGDYEKYTNKYKSKCKPSEYCAKTYGIKNIKSEGTIRACFPNLEALVDAIKQYNRLCKSKSDTLADLLK